MFSVFSDDFPMDIGATGVSKTIVNQSCVNTGSGRGTLVQGQPVICNGTNWLQKTNLSNSF